MKLPRLLREYLALRGVRLTERQARALASEGSRLISREAQAVERVITGDDGPEVVPLPPPAPVPVPWTALVITAAVFAWIGGVIPFALGCLFMAWLR